MRLEEHLGEAATLNEWLQRLGEFPGDGWLVVRAGTGAISLEMKCRPITTGGRELTDEEHDQLEVLLTREGWVHFLSEAQLEDVAENLRQQAHRPSAAQMLKAIEYYSRHDAFVELGDA